jgi:hypothetical protein
MRETPESRESPQTDGGAATAGEPYTSLYLVEFRGPGAGEGGYLALPIRVDERGVVVQAHADRVAWMEGLLLDEVYARLDDHPGVTVTPANLDFSLYEGDKPVHTPEEIEETVRDPHATPVAAYETASGEARAAIIGATRTHRLVTVVLSLVRDDATGQEGVRPVVFRPPTPWERGIYALPQAAGPHSPWPTGWTPKPAPWGAHGAAVPQERLAALNAQRRTVYGAQVHDDSFEEAIVLARRIPAFKTVAAEVRWWDEHGPSPAALTAFRQDAGASARAWALLGHFRALLRRPPA